MLATLSERTAAASRKCSAMNHRSDDHAQHSGRIRQRVQASTCRWRLLHDAARLTETLGLRVRMLKACMDEMLTAFVTEVRAWEATRTPQAVTT